MLEDHELQAQLRTLHNQLETVALHPSPKHLVCGGGSASQVLVGTLLDVGNMVARWWLSIEGGQ